MTKEEAIKTLKENYCSMCAYGSCDMDSCDISYCDNREAIEVLSAVLKRKKGEWIKVHSGDKDFPESIVCSKCWNENSHFDFNEHAEPIGKVFVTSRFCPNCGADMRPEPYGGDV